MRAKMKTEHNKSDILLFRMIEQKVLTSYMNNTKWNYLICRIVEDLPFGPAFQIKLVTDTSPYPLDFDKDVAYWCNWNESCRTHVIYEIELNLDSKTRIVPRTPLPCIEIFFSRDPSY